jgi:hypothetical protein
MNKEVMLNTEVMVAATKEEEGYQVSAESSTSDKIWYLGKLYPNEYNFPKVLASI